MRKNILALTTSMQPFKFTKSVHLHHSPATVTLERPTNQSEKLSFAEVLSNGCPTLKSFHANPFLPSPHFQTLYPVFKSFEGVNHIHYARKLLETTQGGMTALDFVCTGGKDHPELPARTRFEDPAPSDDDQYMVVLLHGLAGGSNESYVRAALDGISFPAVVMNARGCGLSEVTSPHLFSAMWTEDLDNAMTYLKKIYPRRRFFVGSVIDSAHE
ncbi:putative esterase [Neolecta irregularis DAH-3]|uniref:Putative esterase n=1 Tax=Neolecta irregularis (strain DAH-3) TaxID=1198029 RepID=A0A1U7LSB1_NEOID|nr:putative esterase [Neolecta irregularis DAH-3]|eukprot:OLL25560.1 putative esterase [Neolecta irregularis DAH-3]